MRRWGKIIWVLFYIAFIPFWCMRYTSILLGAIVKSFVKRYYDEKLEEFDYFSIAGYISLASLFWPLLYCFVVIGAILFRIYAYVVMII